MLVEGWLKWTEGLGYREVPRRGDHERGLLECGGTSVWGGEDPRETAAFREHTSLKSVGA